MWTVSQVLNTALSVPTADEWTIKSFINQVHAELNNTCIYSKTTDVFILLFLLVEGIETLLRIGKPILTHLKNSKTCWIWERL